MLADVKSITVIILGLIALYLLLSSKNTNSILSTGGSTAVNGIKALQGR